MSRRRRWVDRLAALTAAVVLAAPLSTSAERRRPEWTEAGDVSRGALLRAMNEERERRGLPPLHRNVRLDAAAGDRIHDMFEHGYFDHVAPDGTEPFVWVRDRGYRYVRVGENLATGQRAARQVVEQWMGSPGHRANVLGNFEDTGIAIAPGSPDGRSGHGYTFVAMYGRARDDGRTAWGR
jgi:uncharacterized protein YkwD